MIPMIRPSACRRTSVFVVAVILAALFVLPASAKSQTVRGRLFETGTTTPIASATVYLLDDDSNQVDVAETDEDGAFTLEASEPGAYYVQAEMTDYRTKTDGVLELGEGGEISIRFFLMPQPIAVPDSLLAIGEMEDPIAAARTRFLAGQGFFKRLSEGFGEFVTPEQIEERQPTTAQDLFQRVRSVRVREYGVSQTLKLPNERPVFGEVLMMSGQRNPTVFIDGRRVWPPAEAITSGCRATASVRPEMSASGTRTDVGGGNAWPFPVEDFLDPTAIQAIEVYDGPAEVPAQYNVQGASCGVILIWTG